MAGNKHSRAVESLVNECECGDGAVKSYPIHSEGCEQEEVERDLISWEQESMCGLESISVPRTGLQSEPWKSEKEEESYRLKVPCYWSSALVGV